MGKHIGGKSVRNKDGCSIGLCSFDSLCYILENWQSEMFAACFLRVCASDDLCAFNELSIDCAIICREFLSGAHTILDGLLCVEAVLLSAYSLE